MRKLAQYPLQRGALPDCGSCVYWNEMPPASETRGQCRRRPPIATDMWVETWAEDWCGEYAQTFYVEPAPGGAES